MKLFQAFKMFLIFYISNPAKEYFSRVLALFVCGGGSEKTDFLLPQPNPNCVRPAASLTHSPYGVCVSVWLLIFVRVGIK